MNPRSRIYADGPAIRPMNMPAAPGYHRYSEMGIDDMLLENRVIFLAGVAGPWFALGSLALGLWWVAFGANLLRSGSDRDARRVFLASLIYLPAMLGLMVADSRPLPRRGAADIFPVAAAYAGTDTPVILNGAEPVADAGAGR